MSGISFGLSAESAIPILFCLLLCWGFIRIINSPDNPIEFWHFFSAYNPRAGKEYGDINSLGMMAGIVACLFVIVWTTYKADDTNPWTLGVCLVYLGGVKAFSAWLRTVAAKRYGVTVEPPSLPETPSMKEVSDTHVEKKITQE